MLIIFQSILWSVFGVIIYRAQIVNANIPRLLGRSLYWLGVPLQIFFLARKANFEQIVWLPPIVTVLVLLLGLALVLFILRLFQQLFLSDRPKDGGRVNRQKKLLPSQSTNCSVTTESTSIATRKTSGEDLLVPSTNTGVGSFILASILGNTGFVGLALIPSLVEQNYWSWLVLYGVAHNVLGSYGLGVLVADYYSHSQKQNNWLDRLQNLLFLPSLWAFAYGYASRNLSLPALIEIVISKVVLLIVPGAFILIGMQLSKLQQWQNLRLGIFPTIFKMLILPGVTGLLLTCFGLQGDGRLVLVLMSGMPTAFASIILAEAYNLDRNVTASSILLSTLSLPIALILWLTIF